MNDKKVFDVIVYKSSRYWWEVIIKDYYLKQKLYKSLWEMIKRQKFDEKIKN